MKPNVITYPLAVSGELYRRIAPLVNTAAGYEVMDGWGRYGYPEWETVPVLIHDRTVRFLLKSLSPDMKEYMGVELTGDFSSPDAVPGLKWFVFHENTLEPVYHPTPLDALEDFDSVLPPEHNWLYNMGEEEPGYMDWEWWYEAVREVEKSFDREGISHDKWEASPGRYRLEDEHEKVAVLCNQKETRQHLGFILVFWEMYVESITPFIYLDGKVHLFSSVQEALASPQDRIEAAETGTYVLKFFNP